MTQPETGWLSRWVVALSEPLVDTASRIEIDEQVISLIAAQPHQVAAWLSGFLSDLVRSLDPEDPWRKLTIHGGQALHPDGSPFGTWVDATDVVPPSTSDLRSDLGLAALEKPLNDEAAQLIAVASEGWDRTLSWCESNLVSASTLDRDAAESFFASAGSAMRWAIHRRRLFAGAEDPFIPVSAVAWISRAEKMTSGEEWDEARAARHLEGSKIQPGTYSQLT